MKSKHELTLYTVYSPKNKVLQGLFNETLIFVLSEEAFRSLAMKWLSETN